MKDPNYKPRMVVRMTLTLAWQNKLLGLLHTHFGISESFTEPHTLYVDPQTFLKFIFAANSNGKTLTLKQLGAEFVDFKKEPRITVVKPYSSYTEGNDDGQPFATLVDGHVQLATNRDKAR